MNTDKLLDFEKYWNSEENSELRRSCSKGWALRVWQASRESIEVYLPEGLTLNEMRYGSKPKPDHQRLLPRTTCIKAIESFGLKVKP